MLSLHLVNITLAIRVGVPLLTDEDIVRLSEYTAMMAAAAEKPDHPGWEVAYRDFLLTIVNHVGLRVASLVEELLDNIQRYRETTLNRAPVVYVGGDQFTDFVEAVKQRDGVRAAANYAKFAGRVSSLILAGVAPHYEPARLRAYIRALEAYEDL